MKTPFSRKTNLIVAAILLLILTSLLLYSYPTGITGRTLKTTTQGCGNCHTYNTNVTGSVSGPDTVTAGQTVQFTITVTDPSRNKAGVDIAVRLGALNPGAGSSDLKLLNSELTHLHAIQMTNHTVTVPFNYIAPGTPGIDTIFSTVSSGIPAWNWSPNRRVVVRGPTGIKNKNVASEFKLHQNYPNPFNPKTTITFALPKESYAKVKIFDVLGNEILTLVDNRLEAGIHEISWDAAGYSSGVYFYKLETEDNRATMKMMLLK